MPTIDPDSPTNPANAEGFRVRILDLSGGAEDNIVEEITGFDSLMHANAFASRYVRDSVERCRARGLDARAVLEAWFAFGEDAEVINAGPAGWRSAAEVATFAAEPAPPDARNWRALDPRRITRDPTEPDDEN